jgi:hypothetical protein
MEHSGHLWQTRPELLPHIKLSHPSLLLLSITTPILSNTKEDSKRFHVETLGNLKTLSSKELLVLWSEPGGH